MMHRALFFLLANGACGSSSGASLPFEWGAVFAVDGHDLTFTASKIAHMKIVLQKASAGTNEAMHALVDSKEVGHCFAAKCTEVESGGKLTYNEDSCYELHVDGATDATFKISGLKKGEFLAIFTEHGVKEFEGTPHYLREIEGSSSEDIEPVATFVADETPTVTLSVSASGSVTDYTAAVQTQLTAAVAKAAAVHAADVSVTVTAGSVNLAFTIVTANATMQAAVSAKVAAGFSTAAAATALFSGITGVTVTVARVTTPGGKPWAEAIGASLVVCACTLLGVILAIPVLRKVSASVVFGTVTSAFASGAILATAFFLVLLEASHMTGGTTEAEQAAIWGSFVLGGFLTPSILHVIVSLISSSSKGGGKGGGTATPTDIEASKAVIIDVSSSRTRVLCGILLGDFLHNTCDGLFIGTAFLSCGSTMGWSVTAAAVYHELAQELADYVLLTDPKKGNLKPAIALLLNFISGLSVLVGVVIMLSLDTVSPLALGRILAFSGGVYLQIGAAESMPRTYELAKTPLLQLTGLIAFAVGAAAIGLALLDHKHCSASTAAASAAASAAGAGGAHAGHGHRLMI